MMKRIIKELKKYKYTTIALVIFVVALIAGYFMYTAFFGSRGTPVYGNRLDGIDAVMPSDETKDSIINSLKEIGEVNDATMSISGKTINIIVTVKSGTASDKANTIPSVAIAKLTSEQLSYFDVQVFIKSEKEEDAGYPIIAYKDKSNDNFSFTYNK